MREFGMSDGKELKIPTEIEGLKVEHVLQRYRDVWTSNAMPPYLWIERSRLLQHMQGLSRFPVFAGSAILFQNHQPKEIGQLILTGLVGSGMTAGTDPSSKAVVEGPANPLAYALMRFNSPFQVGMHPYAASGQWYLFVDGDQLYQRKIADLDTSGKYSVPKSDVADFDRLSVLSHEFHQNYINAEKGSEPDLVRLSSLLDEMFVENEKILAAVAAHHEARWQNETVVAYDAPRLTRYGRLVLDPANTPTIEISYALLHYETSLRQFHELKRAESAGDMETALRVGVECVVSTAACIEAVANKLVRDATGVHPTHTDKRQPLKKINESAAAIAAAEGRSYSPLVVGTTEYDTLDRVRMERNRFMHANEVGTAIDASINMSSVFSAVNVSTCRGNLKSLRVAVRQVFSQLPSQRAPIVVAENVRWLEDLEVP